MTTSTIRAWDLPTRLFHWTLAGLFVGAFAVAHLADEHTPAFAIHMLLGIILLAALAFRLAWGLSGRATPASARSSTRQPRCSATCRTPSPAATGPPPATTRARAGPSTACCCCRSRW